MPNELQGLCNRGLRENRLLSTLLRGSMQGQVTWDCPLALGMSTDFIC